MSTCVCQSTSINLLNVTKFESVKKIIKDKGLRHVNDQCNLMFCSPVGNQDLFNHEFQANIVLSGFCVAPKAAISFAKDLQCYSPEDAAIKNIFNTNNMKEGIKKLLKSIGFKNYLSVVDSSKEYKKDDSCKVHFLMTQLLCMISPCGRSDADDVMRLLSCHKEIREEAERCLCCWVKRIEEKVELGSIILLMGDDALELLNETIFDEHNYRCKIYSNKKELQEKQKESLCRYISNKYTLIPVIHASGINRSSNFEKNWYKKEERALAHSNLLARFSTDEIEKELPALS